MNYVTTTMKRFDVRCVEGLYEPEDTNVLWVTRDTYGRITSIKQFWNGSWVDTTTGDEETLRSKVNASVHVVKVTGSISSGAITCKDANYIPTTATECRYATKGADGKYTWANGTVKYDSTNTGTNTYYVAFFAVASGKTIPEEDILDFTEML